MKKVYKHNPPIPYGLHDMKINKMEVLQDKITFHFENGYVELIEPYNQVDGVIVIEGIDFEFVSVHLLSNNGQYGCFHGEKLGLVDFLAKYDWISFEVVDELYGYNQVLYSGYLDIRGKEVKVLMLHFILKSVINRQKRDGYSQLCGIKSIRSKNYKNYFAGKDRRKNGEQKTKMHKSGLRLITFYCLCLFYYWGIVSSVRRLGP